MEVFTPRNSWVWELGSLVLELPKFLPGDSTRQLKSHPSCPGRVKVLWGPLAQRESALPWRDWEVPAQVRPERRCVQPAISGGICCVWVFL